MIDQAEKLRRIIDGIKVKNNENEAINDKLEITAQARVIAITSGKGGVGKTNMTINIGVILSEMGYRVAILDADLGLANVEILFGINPQHNLLDVIRNKKNILEVLTDGPNNIKFISGGSGVEELAQLDTKQLDNFLSKITLLDKMFDFILIDTAAGISPLVLNFVMSAGEIIIVTTPEPTSITDAYALIKVVSKKEGSGDKNIKVIVNRAENSNEANEIYHKLSVVAEKFLSLRLNSLGYVLNDECVSKAVRLQKPFTLNFPKSSASKQVKDICNVLIKESATKNGIKSQGMKGFINKLVHFLSA